MLWFDRVPCQDTVRPARANLMALSRDGKDADHKTGGPRYSLLLAARARHSQQVCTFSCPGLAKGFRNLRSK